MSVAMRVAGFFVATETEPAAAESTAAPAGGTVILLAAPSTAAGLGCALALGLARAARSSVAAVLEWVPGSVEPGSARLPGAPAAQRLARSLAARDVPARATGRLVRATLPGDDEPAAAAIQRAAAAIPAEHPVVVALGGARGEALDGLLAAADFVVVPGPEGDPATAMALAGAAFVAHRVVAWPVPPGPGARRFARAGLLGPAGRTAPCPVRR